MDNDCRGFSGSGLSSPTKRLFRNEKTRQGAWEEESRFLAGAGGMQFE